MQPTIAVAEIRAEVINMNAAFPVRVHGQRRMDYFFHPAPPDGKLLRRYRADCEQPDNDRGIFPIAQANEDLLDLQWRNDTTRIVVSVLTTADDAAFAEAEAERKRGIVAGIEERERQLQAETDAAEQAKAKLENAEARIEKLSQPGALATPPADPPKGLDSLIKKVGGQKKKQAAQPVAA